MIVLITGPVRSGKSARALHIAAALSRPVTYIATARVDGSDEEMVERVARHRADRGTLACVELWTPGTPDLPVVVARAPAGTTLLIDSLGTWVAGHLLDLEALIERDVKQALRELEALTDPLIAGLRATSANIVIVSEEAGWGLVPSTRLGRIFRDHLGRLSQRIAGQADRLELVVAGYALDIKTNGVPIAYVGRGCGEPAGDSVD